MRLLRIDRHARGDCVVVTPVGVLRLVSYVSLRDTLLELVAEHPMAVVVDLHDLQVDEASLLSVFPAVAMVSAAPPVPLLLAGGRGRLAQLLVSGAVPWFVPTYPTVRAALDAASAKPARRRRQRDLPCTSAAPRQARQWIRQMCDEWELPAGEPLDTAVIVASELVENMVRHARTPGRLRLEQHRSGLTVAVSDGSGDPPFLRPEGGSDPVGGLAVVDALASVWGHHLRHPHGKVVWAVLPFPAARPLPVAPRVPVLPLRTAFALADLGIHALWLRCVGLGGALSQARLTAALSGDDVDRRDHDLIAHALNEHFAGSDLAYSVPYGGDGDITDPDD